MSKFDPEAPAEAADVEIADEVPEADALEQHSVVHDDEAPIEPIDPEVEADPADVDEQRRGVPLIDDERPLPDEGP
jgi:hypothetical protein